MEEPDDDGYLGDSDEAYDSAHEEAAGNADPPHTTAHHQQPQEAAAELMDTSTNNDNSSTPSHPHHDDLPLPLSYPARVTYEGEDGEEVTHLTGGYSEMAGAEQPGDGGEHHVAVEEQLADAGGDSAEKRDNPGHASGTKRKRED